MSLGPTRRSAMSPMKSSSASENPNMCQYSKCRLVMAAPIVSGHFGAIDN
jgi:hypothetical protein